MESWTRSFAVNSGLFGIGPGCRVAVLGDLVHSLALYGALEAVHLGAGVQLLAGMRPDRQARVLAADVIYATPAQLRLLVEAGWRAQGLILVGGSKLDQGLRRTLAGAQGREFFGAA